VLVNNAGYGTEKPILEMELAEWQGVIDVNLNGAFVCAQTAAKRLVEQGRGGRIVNVTSVHEHIPLEGSGPYTASKHGLGGLTKVLALELAEHGITVNSVAPGQIATRMTGQEDEEPAPSEGIPLGRAGEAHEIAALVAWLAGPAVLLRHRRLVRGRRRADAHRRAAPVASAGMSVDIAVHGASGFVGRLTARYLARHAPADVSVALSGRSREKVERVRSELGVDWPVIEADSSDARRWRRSPARRASSRPPSARTAATACRSSRRARTPAPTTRT
jgi:NAD(P)-dependent dehydrogenase (short-subunit alcohol dehydrogenase family)